jgi:hypothetical protein
LSYDLTIKADDRYSQRLERQLLDELLLAIPGVSKSGASFCLDNRPEGVYLEIDAYIVDENGDLIETEDRDIVNRIDIHIPAAYFDSSQGAALDIGRTVASRLNWTFYDEQTGRPVDPLAPDLHALPERRLQVVSLEMGILYAKVALIMLVGAAFTGLTIYLLIRFVLEPLLSP